MADVARTGRTDPRIDRTRRSVVDAVVGILVEDGADAVTHQRVAERAGVGRATIYRHWPTAADLLYEALSTVDRPLLRRGPGPLVEWLRSELRRAASEIGVANAVQFLAVLIGRAPLDPTAADLRRRVIDQNVVVLAAMLGRATERGELIDEPEPYELLAHLLGPIVFRVAIEGREATDELVDVVVANALAPWLAAGETRGEATLRQIDSNRAAT